MIKYVHPVNVASAEGLVAEVYAQIKRDFGRVVEPFTMHSPSPKLLAGVWMACREAELVGNVPRSFKESVAAAVSKLNQCPYCVDAHTIMLNATGEHTAASSISDGDYDQIANHRIRSLVNWALATDSPESRILRSPPFSRQDAPEIIGTAVFYHYITPVASVLLSETPLPSNNPWLNSPLKRAASLMFHGAVNRSKNEGESLRFLPQAELPADLCWAEERFSTAQAFARFAAAIEAIGEHTLPTEVREVIQRLVNGWNGKAGKLSQENLENEICEFENPLRSAARLTHMTLTAPYRINEKSILQFRQYFPEDEKLLGALAWASFTRARKIGTWLNTYRK